MLTQQDRQQIFQGIIDSHKKRYLETHAVPVADYLAAQYEKVLDVRRALKDIAAEQVEFERQVEVSREAYLNRIDQLRSECTHPVLVTVDGMMDFDGYTECKVCGHTT